MTSYPGQEEEVMHLMKQLDEKIGFRHKYRSRLSKVDI